MPMKGAPTGAKRSWKDHLLKSGVPLEYEVAAILDRADMAINADFSFLRRDVVGAKEFSVDVLARYYGPSENDVGFELDMLVECKYRSPEKTLLLLEHPGASYSPVTLGGTV